MAKVREAVTVAETVAGTAVTATLDLGLVAANREVFVIDAVEVVLESITNILELETDATASIRIAIMTSGTFGEPNLTEYAYDPDIVQILRLSKSNDTGTFLIPLPFQKTVKGSLYVNIIGFNLATVAIASVAAYGELKTVSELAYLQLGCP